MYAAKPELHEICRKDDECNSINKCSDGAREDEDARVTSCRCWKKCDVRTVVLTSEMKSHGSAMQR